MRPTEWSRAVPATVKYETPVVDSSSHFVRGKGRRVDRSRTILEPGDLPHTSSNLRDRGNGLCHASSPIVLPE